MCDDEENYIVGDKSQSRLFNFDNCIIREHDESSCSSVISWPSRLEDETSSSSDTNDENTETTDFRYTEDDSRHLKVSVKDSFILMLGFLNRIEKYVEKSCPAELLEELEILKLILANSAENFGFRTRTNKRNKSGEVSNTQNTKEKQKSSVEKSTHYKNETSSKLADKTVKTMEKEVEINSVIQKQPESSTKPVELQNKSLEKIDSNEAKVVNGKPKSRSQLKKRKSEGSNGFSHDMNTKEKLKSSVQKIMENKNGTSSKPADKTMEQDVEINSVVQVQPEFPTRRSGRLQNISSEEIDSNEANVENGKPKLRSRPMKRKSEESGRRVSKRVKQNISMDRLTYIASKLKKVTDEINNRHNTELAKKRNERQMRNVTDANIRQTEETSEGDASLPEKGSNTSLKEASRASIRKKNQKKGELTQSVPNVCSKVNENATSDEKYKNPVVKLSRTLPSQSKRKLYSRDSWLDILSSYL